MKLVSDFDGVWTNPKAEAECVINTTIEGFAKIGDCSVQQMTAAYNSVLSALAADPTSYGWTINGQISAFADEDPFVRNNAVAHFLELMPEKPERIADEEIRARLLKLREQALKSYDDLGALANELFGKATKDHREHAKPKPFDEDAKAIQGWLDEGHDVVIVSNSSTGKIADFLSRSPLSFVTGGPEAHERGKVRIRGGAMKFVIGDDKDDVIELNGRTVRCDRASYTKILDEEQPDAIVGDVVSLDFALPWKRRRDLKLDTRFLLVVREYTPEWSRSLGSDWGFESISQLCELPGKLSQEG